MSSGIVSATNLAQILVGTGAGVSNAQFSGAGVAGGSFSGGEMLGIASGVVLSTGQIAGVVGPNTVGSRSTNHGQPGDLAVYRPSAGLWYRLASSGASFNHDSRGNRTRTTRTDTNTPWNYGYDQANRMTTAPGGRLHLPG